MTQATTIDGKAMAAEGNGETGRERENETRSGRGYYWRGPGQPGVCEK